MNFDEPIDRRGTRSLQWDAAEKVTGVAGDDFLAMWLADSDFRMAEVIARSIRGLADDGFVSYFSDFAPFKDAVRWWMDTRHNWQIDTDWLLPVAGLGNGIAITVLALTEPGDEVMIFTPVYHEFRNRIAGAGRTPLEVEMKVEGGRAAPDLAAAAAAVTERTKMLLLCSPHNPGGQVWTRSELAAMAQFAREHDLILVSDEIHHDLLYPGAEFIPMAHIDGLADRLITLTAPSKTFNIAGLRTGQIIVENPDLRARISAELGRVSLQPNLAGVTAGAAAYSPEGAQWADAQNVYLHGNRDAFQAGLSAIPGVRPAVLEATFLGWVDFTGTGMSEDELAERIIGRARIGAARGSKFGPGGEGQFRFTIATQRTQIDEAVTRLQGAFADLQ